MTEAKLKPIRTPGSTEPPSVLSSSWQPSHPHDTSAKSIAYLCRKVTKAASSASSRHLG